MIDGALVHGGDKAHMRPFTLRYFRRRPLELRRANYYEAHDVWVIEGGGRRGPLVRARYAVLEEPITSARENTTSPRSRRTVQDTGGQESRERIRGVALEETITKITSEPTDPARTVAGSGQRRTRRRRTPSWTTRPAKSCVGLPRLCAVSR
jgi:hypothetical protein